MVLCCVVMSGCNEWVERSVVMDGCRADGVAWCSDEWVACSSLQCRG